MKNEENEVNVLDELNKGACMGMDAISYVLDKVKDNKLKKVLEKQYAEYEQISNKICNIYSDYSEKEPHETNTLDKLMLRYGVGMKTLTDQSNSKISELLLQGTNMGIIEGRKLLNHKETDKEVNSLVQEYVAMQEKAVENLKKFL